MKSVKQTYFRIIHVLVLTAVVALECGLFSINCSAADDGCQGAEVVEPGWERSYKAGYTDSNGMYAGGSELLHLVGHKGKLYAASGYWMDSRNIWYGGSSSDTGWGQILRLDSSDGKWEVDLDMGPRHFRPETLESVTFTTDGKGNQLKEPVNLLITSTFSPQGSRTDITAFVRDDTTGTWERSTILSGPVLKGEDISIRDMHVYRDKVTGIDRIFITIGVLGIFSGVYDADAPAKIRWNPHSESGPMNIRPLAIIEANDSLLFSSGKLVYRRNDGESPTYSVVHDMNDLFSEDVYSFIGGIRGMTAIPNPNGKGDSILFAWEAESLAPGCVYRLDPDGKGGYTRVKEICLDRLIREYLDGNPVYFVLAAYNDMLPVFNPSSKETVNLIGLESWIGGSQFPIWKGKSNGGFYAGAMYAIRDKNGRYWLNEVNGPIEACKPTLVATRTYAVSPFENDHNSVIYFGGHDCNYQPSHNMAWIFSTSLTNALREDAPKPKKLDTEKVKTNPGEKQALYTFEHKQTPVFTILIPGEFEEQVPSDTEVFNARAEGSSLTINVGQLGENSDLSQVAQMGVTALRQIGNGKAELEKETETKLPDGTPAVELVIKWTTKDNLQLITQALIVSRHDYFIAVSTHTWLGNLPDKKILYSITFK